MHATLVMLKHSKDPQTAPKRFYGSGTSKGSQCRSTHTAHISTVLPKRKDSNTKHRMATRTLRQTSKGVGRAVLTSVLTPSCLPEGQKVVGNGLPLNSKLFPHKYLPM